MVQLSTSVYLMGGLLGLFLLSPVQVDPTPASMCTPLKTLNNSLSHRRRYMKHNFPIDYTIRVHQKEVFKLSNINRMRLKVEGLDELVLQRLWFQVNQGVLKKIIRVMPERHPSRPYTTELERRFRDAEGVFVQSHPAELFQQELPETIQETWDHLTEESDRVPESSWRLASRNPSWTTSATPCTASSASALPAQKPSRTTVVFPIGGNAGKTPIPKAEKRTAGCSPSWY